MSNYAIRSFTSGEISPALYARTDLVKYTTGARTVRNFIVRRQGGLDNRPGTALVGLCPTGSAVRLLTFIFNDDQTYVLEFSNLLIRFIREGAYVGAPYSVVTPYLAADLWGLQITQSADVVSIVHPSYAVRELARIAETNWTLTVVTFAPSIAIPAGLAMTPATASPGTFRQWVVTALAANGEESLPSTSIGITSVELPQSRDLSWTAVANAVGYNIYEAHSTGSYGLLGTSATNSFTTALRTADIFDQPPVARTVFASATNYPSAVGQYQQRQLYGGSTLEPEKVFTSRTADRDNFLVSVPTQDDDAITFSLVGRTVNAVRHIIDAGTLIILTSGGAWVIGGDAAGVLRPTDINARNVSQRGSSLLPPLQMEQRLLFVEARTAIVRDLQPGQGGGLSGADLTLFAGHLFEGHTLIDWAYQQQPNSVVWVVRDDGVLLGLTDVAEQEILGWHHHDTDGLFESVAVIPEGEEDRIYVVVNRDGVRMVERFESRLVTDIRDAKFMDSSLTYDGRNQLDIYMTITGGTEWTYDELLTVTSSPSAIFAATDIGNGVFITSSDGIQVQLIITEYVSTTVVRGTTQRTVPVTLRGIATSFWALAVDQVSGLGHLEGKEVAVFADAYVVSSPNNSKISFVATVEGGVVTLDRPYGWIHVGLPYVSDLQTLDLDTPSGASMRDKKILINRLTLEVTASRGLFAGRSEPVDDSTLSPLMEFKLRDTENYAEPVSLLTGVTRINIENVWDQDRNGRVFIRQVDPLPLSILAAIPTGHMPPGSS